jgi:hypothetical protein
VSSRIDPISLLSLKKLYRQAAIVRGAAIRGLGDIKPMSRRSRRHYGFQLDRRYDPNLDAGRERYVNLFDRSERTRGTIVWSIKIVRCFPAPMEVLAINQTKGQPVDEETFISQPVSKSWVRGERLDFVVPLYSSPATEAPRHVGHPSECLQSRATLAS